MRIYVLVFVFKLSCCPADREAVQQLDGRVRSERTSCGEKVSLSHSLGCTKICLGLQFGSMQQLL